MISPDEPAVTNYRELVALIRQQIDSGELRPGQALPSARALREMTGLGKGAVTNALTALRHEGLIVVRDGYGSVVREHPQREDIRLEPGQSVVARMPTPEERKRLGLGEGIPVLNVVDEAGAGDLYPADRYRIVSG